MTVYVTSPLSFVGRFVARDLGGPAAYVARAYRAAGGGVQVAANVPFEITLATDPSMARVRLPAPYGDGALWVTLPCAALRAEVSVASLGVGIGPTTATAGYAPPGESLPRMNQARLPYGTRVFADPTATSAWASTVASPLDVCLRSRFSGQRSALVLLPEQVATRPCRFDGVAGASCGDARVFPRLVLRSCTGQTCVDVAYVDPP